MQNIEKVKNCHSPEIAFILLCCRVYLKTATGNDLAAFLEKHPPDWRLLQRMLTAHGIRPIVFSAIAQHPAGVPETFLQRLRQQCFQITTDNFGRLKELVRISQHFNSRGIAVVPYKGLVLSQAVYGSYSARECADIDLLVLPQDFPTIKNALIADGYEDRLYYNEAFEDYFISADREYKLGKTIDNLRVNIELQWKPLHSLMGVPLENKTLFRQLTTINMLGQELKVLNADHRILLLCAHHGVADVWRKLKHLCDIAMLLKKYEGQVDWTSFEQELKKHKILRFSAAGFQLSAELFGVHNPLQYRLNNKDAGKLRSALLAFPLLSTEKKDLKHLSLHLMLCDSQSDKLAFLRRYLALWLKPNMRDIEWINLPRPLFPLYYILRRFRFLRGRLKKK